MKITREQAISALQSRMDKRRASIRFFEEDTNNLKSALKEANDEDNHWIVKHTLKWSKAELAHKVKEQHIDKFLMKYLLEDIAMERMYSCHANIEGSV